MSNFPEYVVAYGKSLTSRKGVVAQGEAVEVKFFVGGQETFDGLVKGNYIVKYSDYKNLLHQLGVTDPAGPIPAAGLPQPKLRKAPPKVAEAPEAPGEDTAVEAPEEMAPEAVEAPKPPPLPTDDDPKKKKPIKRFKR